MRTHIRDSIHGYVELNDLELDIIDSDYFQRLQRIQQLGLSKLVYPGANHTRFEHSIGVMYISGLFANSLELEEDKIDDYRLAGLVHDIGHGPYSHASESVAKKYDLSHEDFSCQIIDKLADEYNFNSKRVKKIINGNDELGIVSGDIDADRMDYLKRDAHNTGLEHGYIDYKTIIKFANIYNNKIVFDFKSLQALESLLNSRLQMGKSVYGHHTSVIAEKMLQRAIEDFVNSKQELREFMRFNDYTMHSNMLDSEGVSNKLYSRIVSRDLYKNVLEIGEKDIGRDGLIKIAENINENQLEEDISNSLGIDKHLIIVDKPRIPNESELEITLRKDSELVDISNESPVPKSVKESEWSSSSLNIYSEREHSDEISRYIEDISLL